MAKAAAPNEIVYFYSHHEPIYSCFSNFYPAKFKLQGIEFVHSEQALMVAKAEMMGDTRSSTAILQTVRPADCKRLGRQIKPYDDELWAKSRYPIMVEILKAKFTQNQVMKDTLLRTGTCVLAEASPTDCIWGIGLNVHDARHGKQWRGQNLLGKALMEVRSELMRH